MARIKKDILFAAKCLGVHVFSRWNTDIVSNVRIQLDIWSTSTFISGCFVFVGLKTHQFTIEEALLNVQSTRLKET